MTENSNVTQQEFNRAFVLMQCFGYLRRNPDDPQDTDYTGYDFWLTKLNQFNGNFQNADMVKAFILSSEYRQQFGPLIQPIALAISLGSVNYRALLAKLVATPGLC